MNKEAYMGKSRARNRAMLPKRESRERVEKRGIRNRRKGERESKKRECTVKRKKNEGEGE